MHHLLHLDPLRQLSIWEQTHCYSTYLYSNSNLNYQSHFKTCSVSAEIIAEVSSELFNTLKAPPIRLAMHDVPEPTSFSLTKGFYTRAGDIAYKCLHMMDMNTENVLNELPEPNPHDVPGEWFKGPF